MKFSFIWLTFFVSIQLLKAQSILLCGPVKLDSAANEKAKEYTSRNARTDFSGPTTIQVYFHILVCNDGTLPAATAANITTEFNSLVSAYAADNICFFNAGYNVIYNTSLDTNFTAGVNPSSVFDPYRVPNCINVFYMRQIKGNNPSCPGGCGYGGITLGVPNTFCLIATGNIGGANTIAHEVGHCFGLLHTFKDGNPAENINGSNGTTAADQVADTRADPYDYPASCNHTGTGCTYVGTCTDPNGQSNFSPPYTNLMSYWGNCYANLTFTSGQFQRIDGFISTNSALINCVSLNNVTEGPITINSGSRIVSANYTLTTAGTVNISGTSTVTYGGGTVLLKPGFTAAPANGGLTLIKLKQCN